MKFKFYICTIIVFTTFTAYTQTKSKSANKLYPTQISRPKLVVGLVIDQMRWDYLYRFYNRYGKNGFRRLINQGFSVENAFIPYIPTYTACGHASIYTGSVPSINGIIGNDWYDPQSNKKKYCVEDNEVKTVGSITKAGEMSPKNLLVTTITDELRVAGNFKSKVIGISLKDRGSILPVGHTANAAYWYDGENGNWISSTYYMQELPAWVKNYNAKKVVNAYYKNNWKTLYPINSYQESASDEKFYEEKFKGEKGTSFPHDLASGIDKNFDLIKATPFGNSMTFDLAKKAIEAEKLGQTGNTDFLAVSCSSTDYVGHQFGPNSIEIEDTYLRLDLDLQDFFSYLDKTVGKKNYLFFLTADHGVSHIPGFLQENKLPGGLVSNSVLKKGADSLLSKDFNLNNALYKIINNQIYFNKQTVKASNADFAKIKKALINYLNTQNGIAGAVDLEILNQSSIPEEIKKYVGNGYNPQRSGDIYYIMKSGYIDGETTGTTHGAWYPYDSHIPLIFMGWGVNPGKTNHIYYMTDISATLAAMLRIQMPSGCIGRPISELTN